MTTQINSELVRKLGLDLKKLELHQKRIIEFLNSASPMQYKISEFCTIENDGVVARNSMVRFITDNSKQLENREEECSQIATIILAAGAATRFFGSLVAFTSSVEEIFQIDKSEQLKQNERLNFELKTAPSLATQAEKKQLKELLRQSEIIIDLLKRLLSKSTFKCWCSEMSREANGFESVISSENGASKKIDSNESTVKTIQTAYRATSLYLNQYSTLPKAVVPITPGGDTLLSQNIFQQISFCNTGRFYVVIGPGLEDVFDSEIKKVIGLLGSSALIKIGGFEARLINQGFENSTVRFSESGEPVVEEDGNYSAVAGGHGEIIRHFNSISDANANIRCLHIRTIDNIFGTSHEAIGELRRLSAFFFKLKQHLDTLRCELTALIQRQLCSQVELSLKSSVGINAFSQIESLFSQCIFTSIHESERSRYTEISIEQLYSTLEKLFCWPAMTRGKTSVEALMQVERLLMRPLTVYGVVRMSEQDVGGTPVFARDAVGLPIKICLEGAHIQENVISEMKKRGRSAFFFNSAVIFVETEMMELDSQRKVKFRRVNFNDLVASDVFLLAKKQYKGQTVLYHELAMFEILSHSGFVNSISVEVMRSIFKPHKSILDVVNSIHTD